MLKARITDVFCAFLQKLTNKTFRLSQPMIKSGTESGSTIGATITLRDQNTNLSNFIHFQLTRVPQHFSSAKFSGKKFRKVQLNKKMVRDTAFHLRHPIKNPL